MVAERGRSKDDEPRGVYSVYQIAAYNERVKLHLERHCIET